MKRLIFLLLALLVAGSAGAASKVQVMTNGTIDLDKLPTIDFSYETDPASPLDGQIWWNETEKVLKVADALGIYSFNATALVAWDTTPSAFSFTDVVNATTNSTYTSDAITVSGINHPAAISVSGDATAKYSINNGIATAINGTVDPGDEVRAVVTSSASGATAVNATVTIGGGGVSDAYSVTTAASESATYLIDEDFEWTGTPSGWTVVSGSPNFDYTTNALEGSQSISFGDANAEASVSFASQSVIYGTFLFNIESGSAVEVPTFRIKSESTVLAYINIRNSSGTLGVRLRGGTLSSGLDQTLSAATTYRAWVSYDTGTKLLSLWVGDSSSTDRPETPLLTLTGDSSGTTIDNVSFCSTTDSNGVRTMDALVVSESEFTAVQ